VEGLEKKVSCPLWEMNHNSLNSVDTHNLSFITMQPQQLYHMQGCAMTAVVFWTVMRESHCILVTIVMELMQNTVDVGNCCLMDWLQIFVSVE